MLNNLPNEVLETIFLFLIDDGRALGRLSLCSRDLNQRITRDSTTLWRTAVQLRWSMSALVEEEDGNEKALLREDPRSCYIRREGLDRDAFQHLEQMTVELKRVLRLDESRTDKADRLDGKYYVGQAWDHIAWSRLLEMRGDVMDTLQHQARKSIPSSSEAAVGTNTHSFQDRLRAFLAARSLQALQLAECLFEWKVIFEQEDRPTNQVSTNPPGECATTSRSHVENAKLLERYALLINEIQQTPDQLIIRQGMSIKPFVVKTLDELANGCKERVLQEEAIGTLRTIDKIRLVSDYLFHDQDFKGNTDDYHNYRNSLLDQVLETKKGIPISLAILYSCVCWRLDIQVTLIGLPGHVVSSFWTEDGERHFVDVFHKGTLLDAADCRRICESYNVPFHDRYLVPLSPDNVLQRILNNLANSHLHGMANGSQPFLSDLFFHQRALASIHRQPQGIAGPLVNRIIKELPLTLSPDLLRFYDLLAPRSRASVE